MQPALQGRRVNLRMAQPENLRSLRRNIALRFPCIVEDRKCQAGRRVKNMLCGRGTGTQGQGKQRSRVVVFIG